MSTEYTVLESMRPPHYGGVIDNEDTGCCRGRAASLLAQVVRKGFMEWALYGDLKEWRIDRRRRPAGILGRE